MKDNFSTHAADYAKFRPRYPAELFTHLASLAATHECAWDCGTGNGQAAVEMIKHFKTVMASDLSTQQIAESQQQHGIHYTVCKAEQTPFSDNIFDLILVAQAIHWFDFDAFYKEVKRVGKPGCVVAAIGYGLIKTNTKADAIIQKLYTEILHGYWDAERRFIDEAYQTIPFPFDEIDVPDFDMKVNWDANHLIAYLKTWSAVKHFERSKNRNPVDEVSSELINALGEQLHTFHFKIFTRVGRL